TITDIVNSRTDVYTFTGSNGVSDLDLGPDGKIYAVGMVYLADTNVLHVINNPNELGAACNFSPFSLTLDTLTYVGFGMHNIYMKPLRDTISTTTDTSMVLTS